jgi:hypothetical protein
VPPLSPTCFITNTNVRKYKTHFGKCFKASFPLEQWSTEQVPPLSHTCFNTNTY